MLDDIGSRPRTDDLRIKKLRPLIPPAILLEEMPVSDRMAASISQHRHEVQQILRGEDPRLLVVVGPCSIHDVTAACDYAARLAPLSKELAAATTSIPLSKPSRWRRTRLTRHRPPANRIAL